jgi:hypothetical protein
MLNPSETVFVSRVQYCTPARLRDSLPHPEVLVAIMAQEMDKLSTENVLAWTRKLLEALRPQMEDSEVRLMEQRIATCWPAPAQ